MKYVIDCSSVFPAYVAEPLTSHVALAEREGCELVTADDKLIKNLQKQFPFILHLTGVP